MRTKQNKNFVRTAVLCAAGVVFLSGCSVIENWGKAEATVDFGQYQNTTGNQETSQIPETEEESTTADSLTEESSFQETSAEAEYIADAALMEEFYKSEFSEELLAYFESVNRGEDAFSQPIFDSQNRVYSREELDQLSDVMCKIFRNEIYARHGMIFGDEDLNQLYGPFAWYEGTISLRDFEAQKKLPFNETEYENISNVVAVEKARKTR